MSWIDNPKFSSVRPYLKIMRLDNMTGSFLLLWPAMWSLSFAFQDKVPFFLYALFIAGALIMRSAGCIVNDIIDRKVDSKVSRTKNRPLPKGELKVQDAVLLLFLLLLISLVLLFRLPTTAIILGYIIAIPVFIYPFMKRITYWPQIFLAFTINWGALMGWAAIKDNINVHTVMIYIACIFWTLGYDTIYAHQDKEDDMIAGIKSAAIKLGRNTKKYLYFFYGITISLLWLNGLTMSIGVLYHVFLMLGAFQLFWQIKTLNIEDPKNCMEKFASNKYFGLLILIGILAGKVSF